MSPLHPGHAERPHPRRRRHLTILLMLGLGTTLTAADFRRAVVLPRGVTIGLASQYGWMPLLGFTAAVLTGLRDVLAIGLMLTTALLTKLLLNALS